MSKISKMGQYIRIPVNIETRSEMFALSRSLGAEMPEAVMLMIRFLIWADHNANSKKQVFGFTMSEIDSIVHKAGFCHACNEAGIIMFCEGEIQVQTHMLDDETECVRFEKRQQDAERKARDREQKLLKHQALAAKRKSKKSVQWTSEGHPLEIRRGEQSRAEQSNIKIYP